VLESALEGEITDEDEKGAVEAPTDSDLGGQSCRFVEPAIALASVLVAYVFTVVRRLHLLAGWCFDGILKECFRGGIASLQHR
jgi:hypothetical protein